MSSDKKDDAKEIPLQDEVYRYDVEHINQLDSNKPWKNDAKFFKKVRINVLAATKMVKHAIQGVNTGRKLGGLPVEIMGLLVGKPDGDSVVIMDCVELPVEGTETKVVADDEKVLGFMARMQDRIEQLRQERFVGWYHSHPFEVDVNSNVFFSNTDVSTQLMWQMQFGKWVGIVLDPLRCLAKQKVELGCFMAYPPSYVGNKNEGPDGSLDNDREVLSQRWGPAYDRYYQLKHSFFMGSLVRYNLEMMSRKHLWIRQLSSASILEPENRNDLPKRIMNMVKKSNNDNNRNKKNKKEDNIQDAINVSRDISVEQLCGHATQLIKNSIFNPALPIEKK